MSYKFNPFTGTLDSVNNSGNITGTYNSILVPTNAETLASNLDARIRLFRHNLSTPATLNITTAGNDSTGDGTVSLPFLTIDRALQFIGLNNPANITLAFGAGTFTMPTVMTSLYNITFSGTVSTDVTDVTLAVASITTQSNAGQLVFTITRGTPLTNDAWRGKLLLVTTGGTLSRIWCYRNVGNVLYCVTNVTLASAQLTTSSKISLLSLDTNLRYLTANNTLSNSSAVQVTGCQFTGDAQGRVPFFVATDKWQFNDCYFGVNRPVIGQAGGAFIFRSYINSLGDTSEGLISVVRGGNLRIGQGTVIDTQNAATNEKFIRVAQDAKLSFDGPIVCRGLESRGFSIEGANAFCELGIDVLDLVLFENGSGTTSNVGAFTVNKQAEGAGGSLSLPSLFGAITGSYAVDAQKDALVRYSTSSSLTTGLGVNTVSADGGTTLSAQAGDGTSITGANPAYSAEFSTQTNIVFANSPYTLNLQATKLLQCDTVLGVIVVNLPAANTLTKGASVCIKRLNNASINQISLTPFAGDTIDLIAGVTAMVVPGQAIWIASDGVTNWNII